MKLLTNAWVWFGLFCVGLFFITYWGLGMVVRGLTVSEQPDYSVYSLKVQPNYGNQTEQGYTLQPAVSPNAYSATIKTNTSLVELWERESWAVKTTQNAFETHVQAPQAVLILETPQLSPGLELVR